MDLELLEACPLSDQEFLALLAALDKELEDDRIPDFRGVADSGGDRPGNVGTHGLGFPLLGQQSSDPRTERTPQ